MKKLTGLQDKPEVLEDFPSEDIRIAAEKTMPTFRQMLMAHVANAPANPEPEKAIGLMQVGLKIRSAFKEADVEIENADFDALKEAVKSNGGKYWNHYQAQLYVKMKEWEKEVEPPKA